MTIEQTRKQYYCVGADGPAGHCADNKRSVAQCEYCKWKEGKETMVETEKPTREQRIHAMLDHAIANDYDITTWSVEDIVADLLAFAELEEDEGEAEIKPHIETWKAKQGAKA